MFDLHLKVSGCASHRLHFYFFILFISLFVIIYYLFLLFFIHYYFLLFHLEPKTTSRRTGLSASAELLVQMAVNFVAAREDTVIAVP